MKAEVIRKWFFRFLGVIVAVESAAIIIFLLTGGFDFTLPLFGRVYMSHWLKSFQIMLAASSIMAIIYIIPPGALVPVSSTARAPVKWAEERGWLLTLWAIVAVALFLRIWSLGHGIPEYIFWIDAPQFISATQEYLKGNYKLETGYPFFASHFVEWTFLAVNSAADFLGFAHLPPQSNILAFMARVLNIFYVLGMMAAIYWIGLSVQLRAAGALGAFLLAVSTINVQMSHYFINDMPMAFFSLLSVAAAAQNLKEERLRWYLLAGVLAALSFISKYNGVLSIVFMGFIYLQLHRDRASFIRNLDKPLKSALVFMLVYIALTPTVWTMPLEKIFLSDRMAGLISKPRGVFGSYQTGIVLVDHTLMFFANWRYQAWVLEGLLHPVPMWLAFPSFAYAAYRRRWGLLFVWAGVLCAFVIGKIAKPNAAGWHLLNISPFFLFMAAVGIVDVLQKAPTRAIKASAMTLISVFLLHSAVQDCSFWTLPPSKSTIDRWKEENIADETLVDFFPEFYRETGDTRSRILQEVNSGAMKRGYSTLRELWWYITFKEGAPRFFPSTHMASKKLTAQIFPHNRDLVTTDRIFATGPDTGLLSARRLVLADGAADEVVVMVRNAHASPNKIDMTLGRKDKTVELPRNAAMALSVKRDESRTFLLNGAYVRLDAKSQRDTAWMVGANYQDIGDIYSEIGQLALSVDSYAKSATPYSLLRIMAIAERVDTRVKAFAELGKRYPAFYKNITTQVISDLDWKSIAGYSESIFDAKTRITLPLDRFNKVGMPPESHVITPGGNLYGPYIALSRGEYILDLKWMTEPSTPDSFQVDILTGRGTDRKTTRIFSGDSVSDGKAVIPFTVNNVMDYPLEIRIGDAKGAPVVMEEITLVVDYLATAKKVISKGLAGMKKRKL